MQGKILIVDSVTTNGIVLKVKLGAAFYGVIPVIRPEETISIARTTQPDLIILAIDQLGQIGADLCKAIKADPQLAVIPVIMIGNCPAHESRIAALKAGAEEVFCKPYDDRLLLARIRCLIRARSSADELRLRDGTSRALGFAEDVSGFQHAASTVLLSDDAPTALSWSSQLRLTSSNKITQMRLHDAMGLLSQENSPDLFILSVSSRNSQVAFNLLADLRSRSGIRHAGIIVVLNDPDPRLAADALDMGANDVMASGFDASELGLRMAAQLRRKRMADRLRDTVRDGLKAAVIDPLTGLYNRRYAVPHLTRIVERSGETGRSYAVMIADLDHFKQINDAYGHAAGDAVLVEVAHRLRRNLRAVDLVARIGGEEFLIVMPNTGLDAARTVATRICREIQRVPFKCPETSGDVPVTVSIGVAIGGLSGKPENGEMPDQTANLVLGAADKALYGAKQTGRNKVSLHSRPAA